MDLTPFVPLISVIVGAAATLGGVAITTRSSRRADERRLHIESGRERERLAREDQATNQAVEEARVMRAAQLYTEISQGFITELSSVRAWVATNPDYQQFEPWFNNQWTVNGDMRMRRAIAGVVDDDHRLRMSQILDAVIDRDTFGMMEFELESRVAEKLFMLGFDLTAAYARGAAIGADLEARWVAFEDQVLRATEWTEARRKDEQEKYRAEAAARRAVKDAEEAEKKADPFAGNQWPEATPF